VPALTRRVRLILADDPSQGESGEVIRYGLLLIGGPERSGPDPGLVREIAGGKAAKLPQQVAVVLTGERGRPVVRTCAIDTVTAGTRVDVGALTSGERLPITLFGLVVGRRLREPRGKITQCLVMVYIRWLQCIVHRRTVQLRTLSDAMDEARELRDEIRLVLPGKSRYDLDPIAPGTLAVAPRAVLEIQHPAVLDIRAGFRRLLPRVGKGCGGGRKEDERQHQTAQCAPVSVLM